MKRVNDTYGHMSGDKYLCKSTELMQSVFPPKACMFRTGGDEFVIFLPHTSEEETEELIEKLQQNEEEFFCSKTKTFPVSLSVGYAVVHDETDSVIEAMKLSDSEMYKNKRKRKISRGG